MRVPRCVRSLAFPILRRGSLLLALPWLIMSCGGDHEGEGAVPGEGEGEGEGSVPGEGEGEGEGSIPGEGEGEGEGSVPGEGEGEGEGSIPGEGEGEGEGVPEPDVAAGVAALGQSRVEEAASHFAAALQTNPDSAPAAFGAALSRLLLLVDEPLVRDIQTYVAQPPLESSLVLGGAGFFARLRDGSTCGAAIDLLTAGLPFYNSDSFTALFDRAPAEADGNTLVAKLVALTGPLGEIGDQLVVAQADESWRLEVPGGLIYVGGTLDFGPAEAALLEGALRIASGTLHLIAAYDWGYALRQDLGTGHTTEEKIALVNSRFLVLRDAAQLVPARAAFDQAAVALQQAVRFGRTAAAANDRMPPLAWAEQAPDQVDVLEQLVMAFGIALHGITDFPQLFPPTRVDLRGYFEAPFDASTSEADPFVYEPPYDEEYCWEPGWCETWHHHGWVNPVESFFEELIDGRFDPPLQENFENKTWRMEWYRWEFFEPVFRPLLDQLRAAHPGCDW